MYIGKEPEEMILRIDHVQIAAPRGCEAAARQFYGETLGMNEVAKPEALAGRGGCWFQCGEQQLHVGVESEFRAAKKAHPAFAVNDLDGWRARLTERGVKITEDGALPGVKRFYAEDPWGNRLEFLEAIDD